MPDYDLCFADFGFSKKETQAPLEDLGYRLDLIYVYQQAFLNSVYEEEFRRTEVNEIIEMYRDLFSLGRVALDDDEIVGFCFGYRLEPDMEEKWRDGKGFDGVPEEFFDGNTFYLAELGVLPEYRGEGLGEQLFNQTVRQIRSSDGVEDVVIRTNRGNPIKSLYNRTGFDRLEDVTTDVSQRRKDGEEEEDTRVWFMADKDDIELGDRR